MSKIQIFHNLLPSAPEANLVSHYDDDSLLIAKLSNFPENSLSRNATNRSDFEQAQIYLERGFIFWSEQNWQDAIEICTKALNLDPNLAKAHNIVGNSLEQLNKFSDAIECYAKALEIAPDFAEVYYNLGSLHARQQQWQQSIKYYQQAIEIKPDFVDAYFKLTTIWHKLGYPAKVKQLLAQIELLESIDVISGEECFFRGQKFQQQDKLVEALQFYERGIQLIPDCIFAYQQLVTISEQLEQWEKAIFYDRQILQLQQFSEELIDLELQQISLTQRIYQLNEELESAEQQINLAKLYQKQQRWQLAIAHYQKALTINPNLGNVYRDLARILSVFKESKVQTQHWLQALELEATDIRAGEYLTLGHKLLEQKQIEKAIFCYRRTIQLQPKITESFLCLGQILENSLQDRQALNCYQQGIKYHPHNYRLHYRVAKIFIKQQNWSLAITACQETLKLNPNLSWSHYHLGECYLNQNQWSKAISAYRNFIELESDFVDIYSKLALALDDTGVNLENETVEFLIQEAINSYRQEIKLDTDSFSADCKILELQLDNYQLCSRLGDFYEEQEKWATAIAFYRIALYMEPHQPETCFKLGKIFEQQAYLTEAIAYYHLACDLDSSNFPYNYCLQEALNKPPMLPFEPPIAEYKLSVTDILHQYRKI